MNILVYFFGLYLESILLSKRYRQTNIKKFFKFGMTFASS